MPRFHCTQVGALCWAAAMIPRDYTGQPRALPSCLLPALLWGHGDAMMLLTSALPGVTPAIQELSRNPMAQSKQQCHEWRTQHNTSPVSFQTPVGTGSTSAGTAAKSWPYIRLQYYFIVTLMAFPFSTQSYTTSPLYRNKETLEFIYLLPNGNYYLSRCYQHHQRRGRNLTACKLEHSQAKRMSEPASYLLQTEGELGAGVTVTHEKVKWKPLNALLPRGAPGNCSWFWLLLAPLGKLSQLCKGAEPPWGPQSQPGKPQPPS